MIPVNEPLLAGREEEYMLECLRTGWISSSGRFIEEFEERWASYCGREYGVAVSNGTTALQLAVACLDLRPGDEVIMPTFTIISCAMAVIYCGGVPVLVDSDPQTWTMNVDLIEAMIGPKTRAIMPVHIYGHPVDMDAILHLADKHGLKVIEDAAEAHGAEYLTGRDTNDSEWWKCGSFGDLSCFSFYANKPITTGEGGMVLTNDACLAQKCRSLRNLCFQPARRFYHTELGFNFRLTNLQAAIGLAQVERIDAIIEKKRAIGAAYRERLQKVRSIEIQREMVWARSVFWMFGILLSDDLGLDALELARALKERGVETRPFFLGLHEQPVLRERRLFRSDDCPVAERLATKGLYLPSGLSLTQTQIGEVCEALLSVL